MSKLSIAVLFLLFTLSVARSLLNKPVNDFTVDKLAQSDAHSDDSVRLPSDSSNRKEDTTDSEKKANAVKFTTLDLQKIRPINRRFWFRSVLPLGGCRHQFRHGQKPRPILRSGAEIPFRNDMVLPASESDDRRVPPEWMPFLHQHAHQHHHRGEDAEKLGLHMPIRHYHGFDHHRETRNQSLWTRVRNFFGEYLN
ncbi:unnamed protein product [Cuscuta epithymum]|uniref:Uncharacterized protein n=1 Tax=Cuscuta epithymum TaxID=186058 RepID=A0AAV0D9T7_9ASTE|nr:unnamed protein product [Cuscuta epithymum]